LFSGPEEPEELETRLATLAGAAKRSKNFYVRWALVRTIEDIEDAYWAETAYERFLSSDKIYISKLTLFF
jgi:RHH-type rel operon transcriptional repressor/antitoxin RelB